MTEGSKVVTMEMLTAGETLPVLVLRPACSHPVRDHDASTDTQRELRELRRESERGTQQVQEEMDKIRNMPGWSVREAEQKINDIIDKAKRNCDDNFENVRSVALKNLPSMTREQRKATVEAVEETGNFFTKVFRFISNMMNRVIVLIKKGFQKVVEVVRDVYQNIIETLEDAWDKFLDRF